MLTSELMPVWAKILMSESAEGEQSVHDPGVTAPIRTCTVLLAHGSRDPRWREPFERLYLQLRSDLGDDVRLAYMEFVGPTLLEVAEECVIAGVTEVQILPLFMAAGAHLASDIPEQVEQLSRRFPLLKVQILPPIGEDPRVFLMMREIIREVALA